jgi:hypothetical protein
VSLSSDEGVSVRCSSWLLTGGVRGAGALDADCFEDSDPGILAMVVDHKRELVSQSAALKR